MYKIVLLLAVVLAAEAAHFAKRGSEDCGNKLRACNAPLDQIRNAGGDDDAIIRRLGLSRVCSIFNTALTCFRTAANSYSCSEYRQVILQLLERDVAPLVQAFNRKYNCPGTVEKLQELMAML
jgi:hypothetical protein